MRSWRPLPNLGAAFSIAGAGHANGSAGLRGCEQREATFQEREGSEENGGVEQVAGEREPEALTAELDDNSALIVRHILELL